MLESYDNEDAPSEVADRDGLTMTRSRGFRQVKARVSSPSPISWQ